MSIRPLNIFAKNAPLFSTENVEYYFSGKNGNVGLSSNEMLLEHSGSENSQNFSFDPIGFPLKSTQQIPIDWSKFENHTFFNSAEANVNMAFNTIINDFPFDGSRQEIQNFLDGLTGFEKWIYDSLPKNIGYLKFRPANENYISVTDKKGYFYPEISKNPTGEPILDPGLKSITFEFDFFQPDNVNLENSVLLQKLNNGNGISVFLSKSLSSDSEIKMVSVASSGSAVISSSVYFPKGVWNHAAVILNRTPGVGKLQIFDSSSLKAASETSEEFGYFNFLTASFLIGSGTAQKTPEFGVDFIPVSSLSGALDDFRIFHEARNLQQIKDNLHNTVFPIEESSLKLLYRFNEPTGSFSGNDIILDQSGNGLHSVVQNFSTDLRIKNLASNPDKPLENLKYSPVLFPLFTDTVSLNTRLLTSASQYDANNPSLITKLIPRHYLDESTQFEGFEDEEANTADVITSNTTTKAIPGTAKIGSPQIISAFLFITAKQFDEYKIFIDHFSKLLTIGYDKNDSVSDQLIEFWSKYNGIEGQPFVYKMISMAQFFQGINLTNTSNISENNVKNVTAQLTRRFLNNFQDVVRSKGTRHSIESIFRAIGIDPTTSVRIREYGGAAERDMSVTRRNIAEIRAKIDFSGSLANSSGSLNTQGINPNMPIFMSPFLSGSRVEVGFPNPVGTFVDKQNYFPHGISDDKNDGLYTSGSFTVETLVRYPNRGNSAYSNEQSILRIHTTGSNQHVALANIIAVSQSLELNATGSLQAFVRAIDDSVGPSEGILHLILTGVNVFDGDDWFVSFGRDKGNINNTFPTASYFLRAGKNLFGNNWVEFSTNSIFNENAGLSGDLFSSCSADSNASGTFVVIGSQSLNNGQAGLFSNTYVTNSLARQTKFEGQFSELRFFSKAINHVEFLEHIKNPRSEGVDNPLVNFNFETKETGSFERMRLNASFDQPVTQSALDGTIQVIDFSQNFLSGDMTAAGFEPEKRVIFPRRYDFSIIEPKFDERSETNKVRIRSFQDENFAFNNNASVAPLYQLDKNSLGQDDTRLSIEIELMRSLDEDIVNIMATLESIEVALGDTESLYSVSYKQLEDLRRIYFSRLTGKINFGKFFEFYNWFDSSIGIFIAQFLPAKTDFIGTNFVIESHILERSKLTYRDYKQYLKLSERGDSVDVFDNIEIDIVG